MKSYKTQKKKGYNTESGTSDIYKIFFYSTTLNKYSDFDNKRSLCEFIYGIRKWLQWVYKNSLFV